MKYYAYVHAYMHKMLALASIGLVGSTWIAVASMEFLMHALRYDIHNVKHTLCGDRSPYVLFINTYQGLPVVNDCILYAIIANVAFYMQR